MSKEPRLKKRFDPTQNWNKKVVGKHIKGTAYDNLQVDEPHYHDGPLWKNGFIYAVTIFSVIVFVMLVIVPRPVYETREGVVTDIYTSEYEIWMSTDYFADEYIGNGTQYHFQIDNGTWIIVKAGLYGRLETNVPVEVGDLIQYTDYENGYASDILVLEKQHWNPGGPE